MQLVGGALAKARAHKALQAPDGEMPHDISRDTLPGTEVKNSAKGSGPDIGEILKAYQLGSAPSF